MKWVYFKGRVPQSPLIREVARIAAHYHGLSIPVTETQLYYCLAAERLVKNTKSAATAFPKTVDLGLRAGLLDWDHIHPPRHDEQFGTVPRSVEVEVWCQNPQATATVGNACRLAGAGLVGAQWRYFSSRQYHELFWRMQQRQKEGRKTVLVFLGDTGAFGDAAKVHFLKRLREYFQGAVSVQERPTAPIEHSFAYILNTSCLRTGRIFTDPRPIRRKTARQFSAKYGVRTTSLCALEPGALHQLLLDEIPYLQQLCEIAPISSPIP